MKSIWVCALLSLLPIPTYSGFPGSLGGDGRAPPEASASQSSGAAATPLKVYVAAGVPSASPALRAAVPQHNDSQPPENFAMYIYWHRTRNEGIAAPTAAKANTCPQ
jgi:hypothetical protein